MALNLACYDIECYTKVRRTPDDNIKIAPPTDFKHTTVSTYLVNKIETKNEKNILGPNSESNRQIKKTSGVTQTLLLGCFFP